MDGYVATLTWAQAQAADVETLDDFRGALEQALHSRVPTLIGARVDQSTRAEWFELIRG